MPAPDRLPVELTTFVGRRAELSVVRDLVGRSRLVTLTGVGGAGKTRLAVEVASSLENEFSSGAAIVELAPLSDPGLIAQTAIHLLGLVENARTTAEEALLRELADAEMLLLLDNCEHLIADCGALAERLLRGCPKLRVLATSRQPMDIPGEVAFSVPPLSLPLLDGTVSLPAMAQSEAIRLFADRGAAARPGFVIEESNALVAARICHRLDGLPLAIELAAARVRSMSTDEILTRLDDRFSLLARGSRGGIPRHRTLRATIDWSHELLGQSECVLFRRLAVFVGGWRLENAESVCADERLPHDDILDLHSLLVDRSLVVAEPGVVGPTRYRLLETIRQYAMERLVDSGEVEAVRRRHFEHFLEIAEAYDTERRTGGSDRELPALTAHRDNLRAALTWSVDALPEHSLRLTAALEDFWRMVSAAEGWRWLQRTLPLVPSESAYRLRALLTAGMLSAYVPAYAEGSGLLCEAAALAERIGDRGAEAWADLWLGRLAFFGGDLPRAECHLERALAGHGELGNAMGRVRALALLGLLRGLALEEPDDGRRRLEEAVGLAEAIDDGFGQAYARFQLGLCLVEIGDLDSAVSHFRAALGAASLGPLLAVPLQGLARALLERDPARAARLLGAAEAHLERTGTMEPAFLRRKAEAARQRTEQLLGVAAAARTTDEGRSMGVEAAIAMALSDVPTRAEGCPGGLTAREAQVASLVARGLSNREIAALLRVSVRTAESHVDHILTKVGLVNRTQLAGWARENGLTGGGAPRMG